MNWIGSVLLGEASREGGVGPASPHIRAGHNTSMSKLSVSLIGVSRFVGIG